MTRRHVGRRLGFSVFEAACGGFLLACVVTGHGSRALLLPAVACMAMAVIFAVQVASDLRRPSLYFDIEAMPFVTSGSTAVLTAFTWNSSIATSQKKSNEPDVSRQEDASGSQPNGG